MKMIVKVEGDQILQQASECYPFVCGGDPVFPVVSQGQRNPPHWIGTTIVMVTIWQIPPKRNSGSLPGGSFSSRPWEEQSGLWGVTKA